MATAGGLVFFAGYQDNTFRAYDAQTGEELWHCLRYDSPRLPQMGGSLALAATHRIAA
jgi:glucose dehydrogenase